MKILIDTNIVLDLLLAREPFADAASRLFQLVDRGQIDGYIAATTITNIFYILRKTHGRELALEAIERLLLELIFCPVDRVVIETALRIGLKDFEDGVQLACAELNQVEAIVTRDRKDFVGASLSILTIAEVETLISPP
jgi:predicted nucleic acid-binding protein